MLLPSSSPAKDMGLSTLKPGFKSQWEHTVKGVIYRRHKCYLFLTIS